jgi:hypothetical protein
MFGEDRKLWQAIWRITTGKYLPVQLFLIIYISEKQIWLAGFLRADGATMQAGTTIFIFILI